MHREFNKLLSKMIITGFETKESSEDGLPMQTYFAPKLFFGCKSQGILILDKLRKSYMKGTVIQKFLVAFKLQKILANIGIFEQMFYKNSSLSSPDQSDIALYLRATWEETCNNVAIFLFPCILTWHINPHSKYSVCTR